MRLTFALGRKADFNCGGRRERSSVALRIARAVHHETEIMLRTVMSSVILAASVAIAMPASAMTIGHSAPRAAVPSEATSPESSMPYRCDRTELSTRIQKRTCR